MVDPNKASVTIPADPSDDLLRSMAVRYDHGLGIPGYYDQPLFGGEVVSHEKRMESAMRTMRQLHEEVVGVGFYRYPEAALASPTEVVEPAARVKELVWAESGDSFTASMLGYHYLISPSRMIGRFKLSSPDARTDYFPTAEVAKQSAQKDFEVRVLRALEAHPPQQEPARLTPVDVANSPEAKALVSRVERLEKALETARVDAIEEAAKVAETTTASGYGEDIAATIRALSQKKEG